MMLELQMTMICFPDVTMERDWMKHAMLQIQTSSRHAMRFRVTHCISTSFYHHAMMHMNLLPVSH